MSKFENFKKSLSKAFNTFAKKATQIIPKKEVYNLGEGTRSATVTTRDWLFFHHHDYTFKNTADSLPPGGASVYVGASFSIMLFRNQSKEIKKKAEVFCKTGILPE